MKSQIKLIFLSLFIILIPNVIYAEDCSQLTGNDKKECQDLEKKAQILQNIIDIKNNQQDTLAAQMASIDKEQAATKAGLDQTQKEADDLLKQVDSLERELADKNKEVDVQKKLLSGLMQSYYEYDQQGLLGIAVINEDISSMLNQSDYLEQSGVKVKSLLNNLQENRDAILKDYEDLKQKKDELDQKKADLADKKETLDASENLKQSLLVQTQGEEAKYQKLLDRVEQQKGELFDFGTASNLNDVVGSVDSYKKPDKKYWDNSNFFSQRDSRWGNSKIGGTKYLMKDFGCAVTSVAMAYHFNGKNYTPKTILSRADFTSQALIYWPAGWKKMAFNSGTVNSQLKNGNVVIVHIKKGGGSGHFVVIHDKPSSYKNINDYVVHDPYFGANLYLGTSRALIGKLGKGGGTIIDQMIISD